MPSICSHAALPAAKPATRTPRRLPGTVVKVGAQLGALRPSELGASAKTAWVGLSDDFSKISIFWTPSRGLVMPHIYPHAALPAAKPATRTPRRLPGTVGKVGAQLGAQRPPVLGGGAKIARVGLSDDFSKISNFWTPSRGLVMPHIYQHAALPAAKPATRTPRRVAGTVVNVGAQLGALRPSELGASTKTARVGLSDDF
jgi:hypothetical protein